MKQFFVLLFVIHRCNEQNIHLQFVTLVWRQRIEFLKNGIFWNYCHSQASKMHNERGKPNTEKDLQ